MGSELPVGLQEARQRWLEAANAANAQAYAACLVEDAIWIPPGMEAIEGCDAVRAWLAGIMEGLAYELVLQDVEIQVVGGWAIEQGRFISHMTDEASGETMTHDGRYLILWREDAEGAWRIDRYVDLTVGLGPG